jgi:chorismate mutase
MEPTTGNQTSGNQTTGTQASGAPKPNGPTPDEVMAQLTEIRRSIDNIDAALIHMLAERFRFTQQVGRVKAAGGLPPSDPAREKVQIARLRAIAEESQLDPAFAEKFLNFLVAEVIHHHELIAKTGSITTQP